METDNIKQNIRGLILHNIFEHKLFGLTTLWQDYMQRQILEDLPKEHWQLFEGVVNELIEEGILELTDSPHLRVTSKGQDLVFLDDHYTTDRLENTILTHLRERNFFVDTIWPRLTYMAYCEKELNTHQKYIFARTIDKMIDDGIFSCDSEYNLRLTQLGQDKIYGKII